MAAPVSTRRVRIAYVLAIVVDALQLMSLPAQAAGPLVWFMDAGLDIVTMGLMTLLLGWHWAFLPSFVVELVPFVDLVPSWTLATYLASRGQKAQVLLEK
nr:hypothetical protein [uncultured Holophaga sp.]